MHRLLLGDESFIRKVREMIEGKQRLQEIPRPQRFVDRPELAELLPDRQEKANRKATIYAAYVQYGYTMKEIGDHLNLHYTTISKIIKGEEK